MRLTVQDALVYLCMPTQVVLLDDISTIPMQGETVVFNGEYFVVREVVNRFEFPHNGIVDYKVDLICQLKNVEVQQFVNDNVKF